MNTQSRHKIDGLQVGRGLAALAVVIFHAKLTLIRFDRETYWELPYFFHHGEIGVSFFFVISGFIICYVMTNPAFNSYDFILKRFFRLWPTYAFCTVLYVALYLVHRNLPATEVGYDAAYILKSLVFWPMGQLPALHPGWSLEHEVLFYLLAALVGLKGGPKALMAALGVSIVAGIVIRTAFSGQVGFDYHLTSPVNICFAAGVALFLYWKSRPSESPLIHMLFGFSMLIAAPYIIENLPAALSAWGYSRFLLEALAASVALYGLLNYSPKGPAAQSLVYLGDRSYSLYLVHFCFIPIFQFIHRELVKWPEWMAEPLCAVFVVLSVVSAHFLHKFVETPSGRYGADLARQRKASLTKVASG